uniref:Uncharacterized protein n=1 Tax=Gadus morhua TaxID=8049 RepID=A0A8C5A749_GADMO
VMLRGGHTVPKTSPLHREQSKRVPHPRGEPAHVYVAGALQDARRDVLASYTDRPPCLTLRLHILGLKC